MRGKIVRFSYLTRRRRAVEAEDKNPDSSSTTTNNNLKPKNWLLRLWDKTAAPFWFARMGRRIHDNHRSVVAFLMQVISKQLYRIEVRGSENFSHTPSTIIAVGHKRDEDIPIIIPRLYLFQKPISRHKQLKSMYIAARDDVYERGFLILYFPMLDFFRPLVARSSIKHWFGSLQACPVKLPDEQTVNQLLNETLRIEGDLNAIESLDENWRNRLLGRDANKANLTIQDVILKAPFKLLGQYATPRMFREPLANRIRLRHHATMHEQLRYLIRILDRGNSLLILPEGKVTPDGRFSKMRAALVRLVQQARVDTRMLPVNLTYDFMDTARANVTVIIGPEVTQLKSYSKSELAEVVREKVAGLSCVTMSGLVSRSLIEAVNNGASQIRLSRFKDEIWTEVQRLRALGLNLDRQLSTRQDFEERFERFMDYAWHKGGFFLVGPMFAADSSKGHDWIRLDRPSLSREECNRHSDNPARYCYNELTELLETWDAMPQTAPEEEILPLSLAEAKRLTAG